MSIAVSIRHRIGSFDLDVAFESHGRLTAIFGASGSGKTSVINVMAGLVQPLSAKIVVDGEVLTDTAQAIAIPVHRRRIGYVFQDARLFPHLSVEQNLHYGRWFAPPRERYADKEQVLSLLGLSALLPRKPNQLSGGEQKRVAIGRALLASPRLLLMDEPMAALDQPRKAEILPYIERLRDELQIPIVYVSHSVAEVTRLADDIMVIGGGRTLAFGATAEIARRLDLLPPEERDEGGVILDMAVVSHDAVFDMTLLRAEAGEAHVTGFAGAAGTRARIRIKARDVMIATERPNKLSALNIFAGVVTEVSGTDRASVNVTIDCHGAVILSRITRQSCAALGLVPGKPVFAVVKAVTLASSALAPRL